MEIRTEKTGGIWHGYLEGHPQVDERALTEEIAWQKVKRIIEQSGVSLSGVTSNQGVAQKAVAHGERKEVERTPGAGWDQRRT